jgi:hypothetical protein
VHGRRRPGVEPNSPMQRGMQLLFQVEQQEIAIEQIGEGENP